MPRPAAPSLLAALTLAALALAVGAAPARAQNCPTGKTCFYVPPQMPPPPHAVTWDMVLASSVGTITGTYTFAGQSAQAFTAAAGTPVFVPLSSSAGVASAYAVAESRGIFVVADAPGLTVVAREINGPWNSSATIKDHNTALGQRFRVGGYALDATAAGYGSTGHDTIILYAPLGATVTVTPPTGTLWHDGLTGEVRTITLAPQQTYLLRSRISGCGYDLTGALVTADAPIALVSGGRGWGSTGCNVSGEPPHPTGCGDDGLDNVIPTTGLGTLYAVDVYPAPDGHRVTVVADSADTVVSQNGVVVATLQPGQRYRFAPTGVTLVETSQPAYVYQDAGMDRCELGLSVIPPLSFVTTGGTQSLAFNVFGAGQISAFLPTAQVASLRLDGAAPSGATSVLVPGLPAVTRVKFAVAAGNHVVSAAGDFQLGLVSASSASGGTGLFAYYNRFRVPGCGDSTLEGAEACDDGNVLDGDGCSAACRIEIGHGICASDAACVANGRCDLGTGLCVARCNVDSDCNDANPCTLDSCNTATGVCQVAMRAAGTACDDGLYCTVDTACDGSGGCVGSARVCPAPVDLCDEAACDEATDQCGAQEVSCDGPRDYFYGVVAVGEPPSFGSIRCWREAGAVACDMAGGVLVVGPPICE